jgi:hypothetical protein
MSDDQKEKSKPTHDAFVVRNYEKKNAETGELKQDASWLPIGVVFEHGDGKGFDVVLDATPVTGRVVCRKRQPKEPKA